MIKFFFKQSSKVEKLLYEYLTELQASQASFYSGMKEWISPDYTPEDLEFHAQQTHKHESKADDIRDAINDLMYGKVLIPESRGDVMSLVGRLDKVINIFERILSSIQIQHLETPSFLRNDFDDLMQVSMSSCDELWKQLQQYLKGGSGIREKLYLIDEYESRGDLLETRILTKVFDSDLDPFLKLQLKELIGDIGNIADLAELIARRINILSLKRRV